MTYYVYRTLSILTILSYTSLSIHLWIYCSMYLFIHPSIYGKHGHLRQNEMSDDELQRLKLGALITHPQRLVLFISFVYFFWIYTWMLPLQRLTLWNTFCVWELMYLYTLHFTCYNGSLPFCANGTMYQPSVNWADDPGDSWIRIIVAAWLRCTTHMKSFKGTLGRRFDRCLMILGSSRSLNCLVLSNWMNWIHLSNFHKWELRVPCVPPLAKFPACSY